MRYEELIQFEPIETVVQLRHADALSEAKRLVSTYVISHEMADRLIDVVFPHLQFVETHDTKALLIVGNYGTGKSHLMSVISSVAEHADLASSLTNPAVADAATGIAGQFQVIRTELGATTMDFRDFICSQLEESLAKWGIGYIFPPQDKIPNHKGAFEDLMAEFHKKFPKRGLLLVVDELLDYLRGRDGQAIVRDLSFLREIGEVSTGLKFRFIAGLQEMLFDNPAFSFVASSVRRVQDRFAQVQIARNDVRYVVANRLLCKTLEQKAKIRDHLTPFAKFYSNMNERMDDFVNLFPVHPDYLDVFDSLRVIEKREVLKVLSHAMKRRLKEELPTSDPGLVAYDSYWMTIRENPAFRSIPDVRAVMDCSQVLTAKIKDNLTPQAYRPMADRIINALSIQRLTTGDIHSPIGVKPEGLRDGLCLYDPNVGELGGEPAEDLLSHVQTVVKSVLTTVNKQFISENAQNGQIYLDLKKTDDYDAYIEKKAELLSKDQLDRYYYEALKRVMECVDQTYVTGFKIWQHELEWRERKASKLGYLFFGAPNERSTAVPSRDFYLYFLQPFNTPHFKDEKKADEVFFRLGQIDDPLRKPLLKFAAATELSLTSSGQAKAVYESKGTAFIKEVNKWLRENMPKAFEVTYQGKSKPPADWLKGQNIGNIAAMTTRDLINITASVCLASHFADQASAYPTFSVLITSANINQAAQDALRWMRGGTKSQQAVAVLDALELLDGDKLTPAKSKFAQSILAKLKSKGHGQVVNRSELIQDVFGVEYLADYRLEPAWVVVLLGALVYNGDAVVAVPGKKLDAGSMDQLIGTPVEELIHFKHIEQPKEWNIPALKALFELVNLPPGKAQKLSEGDADSLQDLHDRVLETIKKLVTAQHQCQQSPAILGKALLAENELAQLQTKLQGAKTFFESIQSYKSTGQIKNFRHSVAEVESQKANLDALKEIESLQGLVTDLGTIAGYLTHAEAVMPAENPWARKLATARSELLEKLSLPKERRSAQFRQQATTRLTALKKEYLKDYTGLHTKARLGVSADKSKAGLINDDRLARLKKLVVIELMPASQLADFENRLVDLRSCFALTQQELEAAPTCPHCQFQPSSEKEQNALKAGPAEKRLQKLDDELDQLLTDWTKTLLTNLADPTAKQNLDLLKPAARKLVEEFAKEKTLPASITTPFLTALKDALAGLKRVELKMAGLQQALTEGGSPATLAEIRERFEDHLENLTKGTDSSKVRILIQP